MHKQQLAEREARRNKKSTHQFRQTGLKSLPVTPLERFNKSCTLMRKALAKKHIAQVSEIAQHIVRMSISARQPIPKDLAPYISSPINSQ